MRIRRMLATAAFGVAAMLPVAAQRVPAPPSSTLIHSELVVCAGDGAPPARAQRSLRIATWNMRAARSAPLDEIASELHDMDADIIALQEVDSGTRRAGLANQPLVLAKARDVHYAFAASIKWDGGDYGLTVLSRWPFSEVLRHRIDLQEDAFEARIVLDVTVCVDGRTLRLLNHHGDIRARSRELGLAQLAKFARLNMGRGLVVLGDFNDVPSSAPVRDLLATGLVDVFSSDSVSPADSRRVDYILVDSPLARLTSGARVWKTTKSDHDALIAEVKW